MPKCTWCMSEVPSVGDTCNLVCYAHLVEAIKLVTYIHDEDAIPKDMHLQPWYAALANTQEG